MDDGGETMTGSRERGARSGYGTLAARRWRLVAVLFISVIAAGHVGDTNTYYEGAIGPYHARVIIRTPGVIPGLAQISVRFTDDAAVERVTVRPLRWDAGLEGAPPPDTARAVTGQPSLYSAELWLMTTGSYSVNVRVVGSAGEGSVFIPVAAVAARRLEMRIPMAVALLGAGAFLFAGAVSIFGAAVRESVLPPGEAVDAGRHRRGRRAMVGSGVALAALAWGGWSWWGSVDAAYRNRMFRPLAVSSEIEAVGRQRLLTLTIDDEAWRGRQWTPLMPDHGKLMHMFLVHDEELSVFAHVHPVSTDSNTFQVQLPSTFPSGNYRLYADIVHESGFAQTLTDTVPHPEVLASFSRNRALPEMDPDDSYAETPVRGAARDLVFTLPSGRTVRWEAPDGGLTVDTEVSLRFTVREPDGSPSVLEPYMGMLSHAAVTQHNGSVFVHLHPSGSINMAAMQRFEREEGTGGLSPMEETAPTNVVTFPYVFATEGPYRFWVQVKVGGVVETAAWDVEVGREP